MPITKSVQADNGVMINYHRAIRLEVDLVANTANVLVNSHADEEASLAGLSIAWQWRVNVPVDQLAGNGPTLLGEIEDALVSLDTSPFTGGARVADQTDTLQAVQDRAWARIKAARERAETGTCVYDGGVYDINMATVTGCVTAAMLAKQAGQAYAQDWTLADNSVRTLDGDQVIAMGMAMMSTIADIYKTGRELRSQIYAPDATIQTVEAIAWPA